METLEKFKLMNVIDFLKLIGPDIISSRKLLNRTINCYFANEINILSVEEFLCFNLYGYNCAPGPRSGKYYLPLFNYGWGCHSFVKECLYKAGFSEKDFGPFLSMKYVETKK